MEDESTSSTQRLFSADVVLMMLDLQDEEEKEKSQPHIDALDQDLNLSEIQQNDDESLDEIMRDDSSSPSSSTPRSMPSQKRPLNDTPFRPLKTAKGKGRGKGLSKTIILASSSSESESVESLSSPESPAAEPTESRSISISSTSTSSSPTPTDANLLLLANLAESSRPTSPTYHPVPAAPRFSESPSPTNHPAPAVPRSSQSPSPTNHPAPAVPRSSQSPSPTNHPDPAVPRSTNQPSPNNANWVAAEKNHQVGSSRFRACNSGLVNQAKFNKDSRPIDFFHQLFPDDILDSLVKSINDYARTKIQQNTPLTKASRFHLWPGDMTRADFLKFLAVVISIGINNKPAIPSYWGTSDMERNSWYSSMFSRNVFQLLWHSMLHVCEPDSQGNSKIEPFVNDLLTVFRREFYPFENLSLDEMVIGWKGRFASRQYNPNKPEKYHIKTFGLCDSITGYALNLLIYFGQNTSYNPEMDLEGSQAVKVFDKLLENYNGKHHIFADRYYTSWPLLNYLQEKGFNYTGTVNTQRKGFQEFGKSKLEHRCVIHSFDHFIYFLIYNN